MAPTKAITPETNSVIAISIRAALDIDAPVFRVLPEIAPMQPVKIRSIPTVRNASRIRVFL
jgi:hypothetical protein